MDQIEAKVKYYLMDAVGQIEHVIGESKIISYSLCQLKTSLSLQSYKQAVAKICVMA